MKSFGIDSLPTRERLVLAEFFGGAGNSKFEEVLSGYGVRTKPQAADVSRDIIWQGNCHVVDKQLCCDSACSNIAS